MKRVGEVKPDVVHGHGSKGGLYARLPGLLRPAQGPIRAYTPHGGSFNYPARLPDAPRLSWRRKRLLTLSTDVFLFESAYIAGRFDALVGDKTHVATDRRQRRRRRRIRPRPPNPDAADFLYVGELRAAKGVDTFLEAIARAGPQLGAIPRAVLVGSGPDRETLLALAQRLGIAHRVSFPGPMPAREAFKLGRLLVVPSRAESMPYIVLEAAAARVPLIATNVGGIPEIFGPYRRPARPQRQSGRALRAHARRCCAFRHVVRERTGRRAGGAMSPSTFRSRPWSIPSCDGYARSDGAARAPTDPRRDCPTFLRAPERVHGGIFSTRNSLGERRRARRRAGADGRGAPRRREGRIAGQAGGRARQARLFADRHGRPGQGGRTRPAHALAAASSIASTSSARSATSRAISS